MVARRVSVDLTFLTWLLIESMVRHASGYQFLVKFMIRHIESELLLACPRTGGFQQEIATS